MKTNLIQNRNLDTIEQKSTLYDMRSRREVITFDGDQDYSDNELYEEEENYYEDEEMLETDIQNMSNPFFVARYAEKIFLNAQNEELSSIIPVGQFEKIQDTITPKMRAILVRWLIDFHSTYGLSSDTLFNSVMYLDIIMSKISLTKLNLQLFGSVCLWISAKMDEVCIPSVHDFLEHCNVHYSKEEFLITEQNVFSLLNYKLHYPTIKTFARRLLESINPDQNVTEVSGFLCEAALLHHELACYRQSAIAFAIIAVANVALGRKCPITTLKLYSHFHDLDEIRECIPIIVQSAESVLNMKRGSTYNKYAGNSENSVIHTIQFPDTIIDDIVGKNV